MNLQGIIGKKSYQSQGFLEDGTRVPLSAVVASNSFISQVKTADKEGYNSIQIAFGEKKKATKAVSGHSKKAGLEKTARFLKEIRVEDTADLTAGTKIEVSEVLKPGDIVNVTGVSKGKGWAGVVKKWHFRGGPRTHGQSDRERAPGSIGQTTTPGRVYKGKKMAGKMGHQKSTVRNLEVIEVTADGVILIRGLVPGHINGLVMVKKVGENKKFVPLYKEVKEEPQEEKVEEQVQAPVEEVKTEEAPVQEVEAQAPTEEPSEPTVVQEETQAEVSTEDPAKEETQPANQSEEEKGEDK